jgi:hypothetical protein
VVGVISKTEYCIGLSRRKVTEKQAEEFTAALARQVKAGKVKQIADKYGVVSPAH